MTERTLQVVQFVHPGFEYRRREHVGGKERLSGVMDWKPGRSAHDRKFMLSRGSFFDPATLQDHSSVPMGFWGEWEGPSVFWKIDSPGRPLPMVVHAPFRPAGCPSGSVQNTDPMVFGRSFIYSNCMQATYRVLRTLSPGSIVLFGRFSRVDGRPSFSLDTCFVVDRMQKMTPAPFDPAGYGGDLVEDAVLRPLHTEGAEEDLTVYFGLPRLGEGPGPFSFFPAGLMEGAPPTFARPELRPHGALDGVVSPGNMQGIKATRDRSVADRDAVWAEVVRQVSEQGCGLGHAAIPPPLLDMRSAEVAALGEPTTIDA